MTNIIGYKGTPTDRAIHWNAMLLLKEGHREFKDKPSEDLRKIAEDDIQDYYKFLSNYIDTRDVA